MTTPEEDSDEECLDDPIKLIDCELQRASGSADSLPENNRAAHTFSNFVVVDVEGEVLIEEKPVNGAVSVPETFDNARREQLLNRCKPLSISIVDCVKHAFYYKNSFNYNSCIVIDDDSENDKLDFSLDPQSINKENMSIQQATKPKIRPVDISRYKSFYRIKCKNVVVEKLCTPVRTENPDKIAAKIDFKRNTGLIGLKISKSKLLGTVEPNKSDDNGKSKMTFKSNVDKDSDITQVRENLQENKKTYFNDTFHVLEKEKLVAENKDAVNTLCDSSSIPLGNEVIKETQNYSQFSTKPISTKTLKKIKELDKSDLFRVDKKETKEKIREENSIITRLTFEDHSNLTSTKLIKSEMDIVQSVKEEIKTHRNKKEIIKKDKGDIVFQSHNMNVTEKKHHDKYSKKSKRGNSDGTKSKKTKDDMTKNGKEKQNNAKDNTDKQKRKGSKSDRRSNEKYRDQSTKRTEKLIGKNEVIVKSISDSTIGHKINSKTNDNKVPVSIPIDKIVAKQTKGKSNNEKHFLSFVKNKMINNKNTNIFAYNNDRQTLPSLPIVINTCENCEHDTPPCCNEKKVDTQNILIEEELKRTTVSIKITEDQKVIVTEIDTPAKNSSYESVGTTDHRINIPKSTPSPQNGIAKKISISDLTSVEVKNNTATTSESLKSSFVSGDSIQNPSYKKLDAVSQRNNTAEFKSVQNIPQVGSNDNMNSNTKRPEDIADETQTVFSRKHSYNNKLEQRSMPLIFRRNITPADLKSNNVKDTGDKIVHSLIPGTSVQSPASLQSHDDNSKSNVKKDPSSNYYSSPRLTDLNPLASKSVNLANTAQHKLTQHINSVNYNRNGINSSGMVEDRIQAACVSYPDVINVDENILQNEKKSKENCAVNHSQSNAVQVIKKNVNVPIPKVNDGQDLTQANNNEVTIHEQTSSSQQHASTVRCPLPNSNDTQNRTNVNVPYCISQGNISNEKRMAYIRSQVNIENVRFPSPNSNNPQTRINGNVGNYALRTQFPGHHTNLKFPRFPIHTCMVDSNDSNHLGQGQNFPNEGVACQMKSYSNMQIAHCHVEKVKLAKTNRKTRTKSPLVNHSIMDIMYGVHDHRFISPGTDTARPMEPFYHPYHFGGNMNPRPNMSHYHKTIPCPNQNMYWPNPNLPMLPPPPPPPPQHTPPFNSGLPPLKNNSLPPQSQMPSVQLNLPQQYLNQPLKKTQRHQNIFHSQGNMFEPQTNDYPPHLNSYPPYPNISPQSHPNIPQPHPNTPQPHQNMIQSHPNIPQSPPNMPQRHQNMPQPHPNIPQPNTPQPHQNMIQSHPNIPQPPPNMPQRHQHMPQSHPNIPQPNSPQPHQIMIQSHQNIPQPPPNMPQRHQNMSQPHPNIPQPNLNTPQPHQNMLQPHRNMPQSRPDMPYSHPNLSQSLSFNSEDPSIIGVNKNGVVKKINLVGQSDKTELGKIEAKNIKPATTKNEMFEELSNAIEQLSKDIEQRNVEENLTIPPSKTNANCELIRLLESKPSTNGVTSLSPIVEKNSNPNNINAIGSKLGKSLPQKSKLDYTPSANSSLSDSKCKADLSGKVKSPFSNNGYSPPILPIPTFEKTFEILEEAKLCEPTYVEKSRFGSANVPRKRTSSNDDATDRPAKRISIDTYKEKTCQFEKVFIKPENTELDLGYDSDSTVKL